MLKKLLYTYICFKRNIVRSMAAPDVLGLLAVGAEVQQAIREFNDHITVHISHAFGSNRRRIIIIEDLDRVISALLGCV